MPLIYNKYLTVPWEKSYKSSDYKYVNKLFLLFNTY